MYEEHPLMTVPTDDTIIWRYMDFTKFVSMLHMGCLYFPSLK